MRLLTGMEEIQSAQQHLRDACYAGASILLRNVGYPGGANDVEIAWHPEAGIWVYIDTLEAATARDGKPGHYWNPIGLQDPSAKKSISRSITVEVNPPVDRRHRSAGRFAESGQGLLLLHDGTIGGGRSRVGKSLFWSAYSGRRQLLISNGELTDFAVVGVVDRMTLIPDIARFALDVARMKSLA